MALAIVAVVAVAWFAWPFGGGGQTNANEGTGQPSSGGGDGNGDGGGHGDGVVGPDSPIKHVVFIVKENRTFNNYFATYGHGAEGATKGGTLTCTDGVCTPGPDYALKPAPDVPPHDITHGFSSGLYSINGGAMNGFNIIGSGEDMSGYIVLRPDPVSRTIGHMPIGSCWPTTSSRPCSGRRSPSTSTPWRHSRKGSWTTRARPITREATATTPTEFAPHFRDNLTDSQNVRTIMSTRTNITNDFPEHDLQDQAVLGEHRGPAST